MAGKNEVTLTFAGDTAALEKAFDRTQAAAKQTGDAFDKAGDKAKQSATKMASVADASDEVNNLGDKATSSLGALSSAFELTGTEGSKAATAFGIAALSTDVLSGASEAAVIVTGTFRNVMEKAKAAAAGMGAAIKANAGSIAVMSAGVLAAAAVVGVFILKQKAAADSVKAVADSLDYQAGKLSLANREAIQKKLADDGLIEAAEKYGLTVNDLTDAVLGNTAAMDKVNAATDTSVQGLGRATSEQGKLAGEVRAFADDVATAERRQGVLTSATAGYTDKVKEARTALEGYAKAVQDQFDPMANLIHRLEDVKDRQAEYNEAVKEHGPKSQAAKDANLALAGAILAANGAAASASGTFTGTLDPALRAVLKQGGLTEAQLRDIETSFKRARAAALAFDGTYTAKIRAEFSEYRAGERNPTGRAHGGGLKAGEVSWVGEQGKELVAFGEDAYVFDHNTSMAMMSGSGGGSWGGGVGGGYAGPSKLSIEFRSGGGNVLDDAIVQIINRAQQQGRLTIKAS